MSEFSTTDITDWYRHNANDFHALADNVKATIVSLLKAKNVDYVTISSRVKTLESVLEKVKRKNYSTTDDITDMLGVRVILYLESDIDQVNELVEQAFEINNSHSVNKSDQLAVDQLGYRSTHHICSLGAKRLKLPELKEYGGLNFEIQVRTLLQHAWAEIEHDRSYKFPGDLPKEYRRRLNLISGTLELIDREFSTLVKDLDEYTKQKTRRPAKLNLDSEITITSLNALIESIPELNVEFYENYPISKIYDELFAYGLKTIGDVKKLISVDFINAANIFERETTSIGFLRSIMMFNDIDVYMTMSWRNSFQALSRDHHEMMSERYGEEEMLDLWAKYSIDLEE